MGVPFNEGDRVRFISDGTYAGVVKGKYTMLHVEREGTIDAIPEDAVELCPPLTKEQAWAQCVVIALDQINTLSVKHCLLADDHSKVRHEMYKVLGAAKIGISEEIKLEVRNVIRQVAGILGVLVNG